MLWMYDDAIIEDLKSCINPSGGLNNTVKMMGDGGIMGIFAQLQEDKITFPAIFLERDGETPIDRTRFNFTRTYKGVPTTFDPETNTLYIEKMVPIELKYYIHVLGTNTTDVDEITRELIFRYNSLYYLTAEVPYESKRKMRFGIVANENGSIRREKGTTEYLESGTLYESIMELNCHGAVMLSYTPKHLERLIAGDIKAVYGNNLN